MRSSLSMVLEGETTQPAIKFIYATDGTDDIRDTVFKIFKAKFGGISSWCSVEFLSEHQDEQNLLIIRPITPSEIKDQADSILQSLAANFSSELIELLDLYVPKGRDIRLLLPISASTQVIDFLINLRVFDSLEQISSLVQKGEVYLNGHKIHYDHLEQKMNDVSKSSDLYDLNLKKSVPLQVGNVTYNIIFDL